MIRPKAKSLYKDVLLPLSSDSLRAISRLSARSREGGEDRMNTGGGIYRGEDRMNTGGGIYTKGRVG